MLVTFFILDFIIIENSTFGKIILEPNRCLLCRNVKEICACTYVYYMYIVYIYKYLYFIQ